MHPLCSTHESSKNARAASGTPILSFKVIPSVIAPPALTGAGFPPAPAQLITCRYRSRPRCAVLPGFPSAGSGLSHNTSGRRADGTRRHARGQSTASTVWRWAKTGVPREMQSFRGEAKARRRGWEMQQRTGVGAGGARVRTWLPVSSMCPAPRAPCLECANSRDSIHVHCIESKGIPLFECAFQNHRGRQREDALVER